MLNDARHAGECALVLPCGVVRRSETAAAVLGGPVDSGEAGGVDATMPGEPLIHEVGGTDRPVVAWGVVSVGSQPLACLQLELVDADLCHHRRT